MRRNQIKIMIAGMLALALMTGCGSGNDNASDNNTINESNSIISMDMEDIAYNAGEQENLTDTEDEKNHQTEENNQSQIQDTENAEDTVDTEALEAELAAYRAERANGTSSHGSYTMTQMPNEENYNYGVADDYHVAVFDSRELNEAFKVAIDYVRNTLNLEGEVWNCIDPRMNAIYEDEDKGVANGYDSDNIFVCEYDDNGNWQYLILVREGKGSDWEVLYHGSSYKID